MDSEPRSEKVSFKGVAGLVIGIGALVAILVGVPATRLFFLLSVPLGVIVAVVLYFWNKRHPARPKEDDSIKLNL